MHSTRAEDDSFQKHVTPYQFCDALGGITIAELRNLEGRDDLFPAVAKKLGPLRLWLASDVADYIAGTAPHSAGTAK